MLLEERVRPRPTPSIEHDTPERRPRAYRPALDGVRAVAVLAVFAYHAGWDAAPGGYLGVDVFFVLSGYLITSLLLDEHRRTGQIALGAFWFRRARRLLPALSLLLIAAAVWAWASTPMHGLPRVRTDLLSALFYSSNWNLIATAQDYFAQYGTASLVRHTWSLAIEEQFYIAWPLLVVIALRLGRGRVRVFVGGCVVAIAGSVVAMALLYSPADPSRAYYGTEARVHQLLIGAVLAVAMVHVPALRRSSQVATPIAVLSVLSLAVVFATVGDASAVYYFGFSAGVAIASASLVWALEVAPGGGVARALSVRPAAAVGRISYGVYLWHWPMILILTEPSPAFAWLGPSLGLAVTRVVFTFAIAVASYRFVEQPIRRIRMPAMRVRRWRVAAVIGAAMVALAAGIVAVTTPASPPYTPGGTSVGVDCEFEICVRYEAPAAGAPVVALIGDSIARSLDAGFLELAERRGWTYVLAASDGCRVTHLLTAVDGASERYEPCFDTTPGLWRRLVETSDPDVVIDVNTVELADVVAGTGRIVAGGSPEQMQAERRAYRDVISVLTSRGATYVLLEIPPMVLPVACQTDWSDPSCTVSASADTRAPQHNEMLRALAADDVGVEVISITDALCPDGRCPPSIDGTFLRYDGHHFTIDGARWAAPLIATELDALELARSR